MLTNRRTRAVTGYGGRISVTEGKRSSDFVDAIRDAFMQSGNWYGDEMLKIKANTLSIGNHVHMGIDNPFITTDTGEVFMRSDLVSGISGIGSSIGLNSEAKNLHATSGVIGTINGVDPRWVISIDSIRRDCPPNKVVTYTQCIWNITKSARDNLAVMKINDYYRISGKTVVQILENAKSERFDLEVWFEDDRKFHVYRDDKRIFESNSAKATAAFIEGGLK